MALDIKNVLCVRIQPSNKANADLPASLPAGLILLYIFCALRAGDKLVHEVFA